MKRFLFLVILAALILSCESAGTKTVYVSDPEATPDDPALVGDWQRGGVYYRFYADGYFQYLMSADDTVDDYGTYTADDRRLELYFALDDATAVYEPYWFIDDYDGVPGQRALALTMFNGSVLYFTEIHR